jgi:chromate transporter
MPSARTPPAWREALAQWASIGVLSFGGPAAQIGLMHREIVDRRGWVEDGEFLRALNVCMLLPGPEALQLAVYLGWRVRGTTGGLLAGLLFLLPAVVLLLGLSFVYVLYGRLQAVAGALVGLEAAVVVLIAQAVLRLARRALSTWPERLIAVSALLLLSLTRLPYPLLLCLSAAAGLVLLRDPSPGGSQGTRPPGATSGRQALATLGAGIVLWALPLAALAITGLGGLPRQLYLYLSRAALLTFGGAYAIVKYVSGDFVHGLGWITAQQSVAGLALAETTPGPLLIVLQHFGFMAGWNQPGTIEPWAEALVCALLATYACFMPSFIFVLAAAPYVESLASSPRLSAALRGVTAFVVGVIASLGLTVAQTVYWPGDGRGLQMWAVLISLACALLLVSGRLALPWVVGLAAAAGALGGLLAG